MSSQNLIIKYKYTRVAFHFLHFFTELWQNVNYFFFMAASYLEHKIKIKLKPNTKIVGTETKEKFQGNKRKNIPKTNLKPLQKESTIKNQK